jgi:hypothetical protein
MREGESPMDLIEALATAAFLSLLAWVVVEIGWRESKSVAARTSDAEAFARTRPATSKTPEPASGSHEVTAKVLSFPTRTPRVPLAVVQATAEHGRAEPRLEGTP